MEDIQEIDRLRGALEHADKWFTEMANVGTLDATVDLRQHIDAALAPPVAETGP